MSSWFLSLCLLVCWSWFEVSDDDTIGKGSCGVTACYQNRNLAQLMGLPMGVQMLFLGLSESGSYAACNAPYECGRRCGFNLWSREIKEGLNDGKSEPTGSEDHFTVAMHLLLWRITIFTLLLHLYLSVNVEKVCACAVTLLDCPPRIQCLAVLHSRISIQVDQSLVYFPSAFFFKRKRKSIICSMSSEIWICFGTR